MAASRSHSNPDKPKYPPSPPITTPMYVFHTLPKRQCNLCYWSSLAVAMNRHMITTPRFRPSNQRPVINSFIKPRSLEYMHPSQRLTFNIVVEHAPSKNGAQVSVFIGRKYVHASCMFTLPASCPVSRVWCIARESVAGTHVQHCSLASTLHTGNGQLRVSCSPHILLTATAFTRRYWSTTPFQGRFQSAEHVLVHVGYLLPRSTQETLHRILRTNLQQCTYHAFRQPLVSCATTRYDLPRAFVVNSGRLTTPKGETMPMLENLSFSRQLKATRLRGMYPRCATIDQSL